MDTVQTTAVRVQIYRQGAEVVRKGCTELKKGLNTVNILGLSRNADLDSVRLYLPAGVSLSDLRFSQLKDDLPSDKILEEVKLLKNQKDVKQLQIDLWKQNGDFKGNTAVTASEVRDYIDSLPEKLNSLYQEIAELEAQIKKREEDMEKQVEQENRPLTVVELEAKEDMVCPFELHSHEYAAGWEAVYEIRTDAKEAMELRSRASIHQNSGDDWKNVEVTLRSSMPRSGDLPKIVPSYLDYAQAQRKVMGAMRANGMMMMAKAAPMMEEAEDAMADTMELSFDRGSTAEAEVSSEETLTEYVLPGRKDLPSGNDGTKADLRTFTLPAEYEMIAVPKKDTSIYLAGKANIEDLPSDICGEAGIYLNDVYAGKTYISPDLTRKTLDVPLGKVEGLQITRTEKKRKTSEALLKNQRTTEFVYEFKLTNNRDAEVKVTVQDRLPISREKTIIVEKRDISGAKYDEDGILTWKMTLGPKETKTWLLAYDISWPKDKQYYEKEGGSRRFCPECGAPVDSSSSSCPSCGAAL